MRCPYKRIWLLVRVLSEGCTVVKKVNPNLASWVFIGISALKKEGGRVEKIQALRSPSASTQWATLHTFISSWAFISPHKEQHLCLCRVLRKAANTRHNASCCSPGSRMPSVLLCFSFSKGKSKYLMTSEGLFPTARDKRQGTRWRRVGFLRFEQCLSF